MDLRKMTKRDHRNYPTNDDDALIGSIAIEMLEPDSDMVVFDAVVVVDIEFIEIFTVTDSGIDILYRKLCESSSEAQNFAESLQARPSTEELETLGFGRVIDNRARVVRKIKRKRKRVKPDQIGIFSFSISDLKTIQLEINGIRFSLTIPKLVDMQNKVSDAIDQIEQMKKFTDEIENVKAYASSIVNHCEDFLDCETDIDEAMDTIKDDTTELTKTLDDIDY